MIYTPENVIPTCSVYFVPREGKPYQLYTVFSADTDSKTLQCYYYPIQIENDEIKLYTVQCSLILTICSDKNFSDLPDLIIAFE